MIIFTPLNVLEASLLSAKIDEISVESFIVEFINSDLALPSATEVMEDGAGFEPILYDKLGTKMLAAFTDKTRIGELVKIAKYCLVMNALQVLRRIPLGYGLVLNPGHEVGLELSSDGIAQIIKDMDR